MATCLVATTGTSTRNVQNTIGKTKEIFICLKIYEGVVPNWSTHIQYDITGSGKLRH